MVLLHCCYKLHVLDGCILEKIAFRLIFINSCIFLLLPVSEGIDLGKTIARKGKHGRNQEECLANIARRHLGGICL